MAEPLVGILMESESDLEVMKQAAQVLEAFGVPHEMRICSAHRMPEETFEYAKSARGRGLRLRFHSISSSACRSTTRWLVCSGKGARRRFMGKMVPMQKVEIVIEALELPKVLAAIRTGGGLGLYGDSPRDGQRRARGER